MSRCTCGQTDWSGFHCGVCHRDFETEEALRAHWDAAPLGRCDLAGRHAGQEKVAPGVWMDVRFECHVYPDEICEHFGWPLTAQSVETATTIAVRALKETWPMAVVVEVAS